MKEQLKALLKAKHILIQTPQDPFSLALSSVLYSIALQLHKKVTLVSQDVVAKRYTFLPWISKAKQHYSAKSDCTIDVTQMAFSQETLYIVDRFLEENALKLNQKIATALYSAMVIVSDNFRDVDGTTFAFGAKLLQANADTKSVVEYIQSYSSLAQLRFLGVMYQKMRLVRDATLALFRIEQEDFAATGASLEMVEELLVKALELPTTTSALGIVVDKGNKVVLIYKHSTNTTEGIITHYKWQNKHNTFYAEVAYDGDIETFEKKLIQEESKIEKKK